MSILNTLRIIWTHPLNANKRLAAFSRFIRWQVGSRLVSAPVAINFVDETRLLVATGMHGATMSIYTGLQEFEDMAFTLHFLGEKDIFVDIGANVGTYTVLASGAASAQTISIEPIPSSYRRLLDNIHLNGISKKVTPLNVGLGEESGVLNFTSSLDTVNHVVSKSESAADAIQVPVNTLDSVLNDCSPALIKMDVEGYETLVIAGAKRVLEQDSLLGVIMELNGSGARYGYSEEALHKTMLNYGFSTFTYSPLERKLISLEGNVSKSGNTLYLRRAEEVALRLQAARKFTIHQAGQEI
jgi:FkbM family methyltransferase